VTSDEVTQIYEIRARADAGATLAAQALAGDVDRGAALEGVLGHFEKIRVALQAIAR
jgi:hypothetical protein